MTEREVAELRRRFKADKCNITRVKGCYVNASREIVCTFDQPIIMLGQEEGEMLLTNLRKTLSGTLGKNLLDIEFDTAQVAYGEEHKLLMTLRNSRLEDEEALNAFYQKTIQTVDLEENYLILLAHDSYDVPYRSKDGEKHEDMSTDVFNYILCSICPVKLTKAALSFLAHENRFDHMNPDWVVSAPELGFLFPAFDNRATNIYNALLYTKDTANNHTPFVDALFRTPLPPPAAVQKETFQGMLATTLAEECSFDVVQTVHEQICEAIELHKSEKDPEPLKVSKGEVRRMLADAGVSGEKMQAFEERYDEEFGAATDISAKNLVDSKKFEVRTPDVVIQVSPERSDLIETRIIDGTRYILICADEGVEVNGVSIRISEDN